MMLVALTTIIAVYVPVAASLTTNCTQATRHCVIQKLMAPPTSNHNEKCRRGQTYVSCTATALQKAEDSGTCDMLPLLAYRQGKHADASSYLAACPSFAMPDYLVLTTQCQRRLAQCGGHVIDAFFARQDQKGAEMCSSLAQLGRCMSAIDSSVCPDQQQLSAWLQRELNDYQ